MNEEQVTLACESFQTFAITEMIYDWIRTSPNPQQLVNALLSGWRNRMGRVFDEQAKHHFEQTGLLSTNRAGLDATVAEAERRIRESLTKMLEDSDEVDEVLANAASAMAKETLQ